MLREIAPDISQVSTLFSHMESTANILNLGASILNLGVSIVGFTLILKRLEEIEENLKKDLNQIKENINSLHYKFDTSVYANFHAALGLANDATTMLQPENRRSMAILAINRFLEAQHIYSNYVDISLKENINLVDKYLLSLSLTYIAITRCYLELEEIERAIFYLRKGAEMLRPRIEKYVKILLISQPIAKAYPSFIGVGFVGGLSKLDSPVELYRLGKICKWFDLELNNYGDDESILFEAKIKKLVEFIQDKTSTNNLYETIIPIAMASAIPIFGGFIAHKIAEEAGEKLYKIYMKKVLIPKH